MLWSTILKPLFPSLEESWCVPLRIQAHHYAMIETYENKETILRPAFSA